MLPPTSCAVDGFMADGIKAAKPRTLLPVGTASSSSGRWSSAGSRWNVHERPRPTTVTVSSSPPTFSSTFTVAVKFKRAQAPHALARRSRAGCR